MKRIGYSVLFLLAGVLFPVLIWVGLGVAVRQWLRERMLQREPGRTIGEILAAAGLPIQWETTGDKPLAAAVFVKCPVSEIQELLARAGL